MSRDCYVCGCDDIHEAKGLCTYHYHFLRRLDHPEFSQIANRKWTQKNRKKRTAYFRKYRQTEKGKLSMLRSLKKYQNKHPERVIAWNKARSLIKKPCIYCKSLIVHKHHPDPLRPLDIIYLCPLHHKQVHNNMVLLREVKNI